MHIENGRVVLGMRTCLYCDGAGKREELLQCPRWNRPQGKPCPHCGARKKHDHEFLKTGRIVDCDHCKGRGELEENYCDSMPKDFWQTVGMRVYRVSREMTWVESNLALGCVYACQDYGRSWKLPDDEVIEKVRADSSGQDVQACKVVRDKDDLELCDHIGIFPNHDGYTVRAVFKKMAEDSKTPAPAPVGQGDLFSQEAA